MNITISKTAALRAIAIFMTLVLLVWAANLALSMGFPARLFAAPTPLPQDEPAMWAVTTMYSVDPAGERAEWENTVCSGMTEKGCSLFQSMYAPAIWDAATQKNDAITTLLQVADTLEDGSQIWKINIAWSDTSADIFIHVDADPTSRQWLLERVLFTQEAAKYTQ